MARLSLWLLDDRGIRLFYPINPWAPGIPYRLRGAALLCGELVEKMETDGANDTEAISLTSLGNAAIAAS